MLEDGIKKKLTARLLALVVIISMISALTGCNEPEDDCLGQTELGNAVDKHAAAGEECLEDYPVWI